MRQIKYLILGGLVLSLGLAIFLSPFASSEPDGLEKVAEDEGFIEKAEGAEVWTEAPVPDYAVPGVENEQLATGLAGAAGTLILFAIGLGVGRLLKGKRNSAG